MKKYTLINLILALLQTMPKLNTKAAREALRDRRKAKPLLYDLFTNQEMLTLLGKTTVTVEGHPPISIGEIRFKRRKILPNLFYFNDGTSVWVRTIVSEVINCLPHFLGEDDETVLGVC
jgi:hypothetical protein